MNGTLASALVKVGRAAASKTSNMHASIPAMKKRYRQWPWLSDARPLEAGLENEGSSVHRAIPGISVVETPKLVARALPSGKGEFRVRSHRSGRTGCHTTGIDPPRSRHFPFPLHPP